MYICIISALQSHFKQHGQPLLKAKGKCNYRKKHPTHEEKQKLGHVDLNYDIRKRKIYIWKSENTKLSIPLPRPSASPERRSSEHTINSLSYWAPAETGSTCNIVERSHREWWNEIGKAIPSTSKE